MAVKGNVFRHACMRGETDFASSTPAGVHYHRFDQFSAETQTPEIRIDGDVHETGGRVLNMQHGTSRNLTLHFGHQNDVIFDIMFQSAGNVRQVPGGALSAVHRHGRCIV